MSDRLTDALKYFCEKLRSTVEGGNEVSIITHLDADGITSGSIMAMALRRMGARYSVRAVSDMNSSVVEKMKADGRDFYILTDLGAGWTSHLKQALGDKWVVIDHHEIIEEEILTTAQSLGLVSVDLDIILTGRETRPLHEALAYSLFHYIDGLTGNKEACYLMLKNAGIKLKHNGGRWRVLAEFAQEEKSAIVEAVAKFVATS